METKTTQENSDGSAGLAATTGSGVLKLWRADRTEIKLVECPNGEWPHYDAEHQKIYGNTHFKTPEEAWEKILRNTEARVQLTLCAIAETEKTLNKLNNDLVDASIDVMKAKENQQTFNRQNE